jgi:hypothetical protein
MKKSLLLLLLPLLFGAGCAMTPQPMPDGYVYSPATSGGEFVAHGLPNFDHHGGAVPDFTHGGGRKAAPDFRH